MAIDMKIKSIHILVQLDDGKIYQSPISKENERPIIDLVAHLHGGKIKVLEKPLESLALSTDKAD